MAHSGFGCRVKQTVGNGITRNRLQAKWGDKGFCRFGHGYADVGPAIAQTTHQFRGFIGSNTAADIPDEQMRKQWQLQYFDLLSPLSITAVQAAYEYCEDWLEQLKAYLDANFALLSDQLATYLPQCIFTIPEATYLAWIDFSAYAPHIPYTSLSEFFAMEAGVLLEDGNMFVDNGNGFIRLNLACPKSVLQEGLNRIIAAVQKHI